MQKSIFPGLFKNFTVFFTYFKFVVLEALKFLSVKKIFFLKNISNWLYTITDELTNILKVFNFLKKLFNFYCYSITVVCLFSPFLYSTPVFHLFQET